MMDDTAAHPDPPGPLSPAAVREFHELGFVRLPGLFAAQEVAAMGRAFDRLERAARGLRGTGSWHGSWFVLGEAAANGTPRIERVVWAGAAEPRLERCGADRRLLAVAAQLLGSGEMDQLINQAHFKLPGDGVEFPWHQDSRHRRYGTPEWRDVNGRGSYVQTVVALDRVTERNGPLELVPGSCLRGHLDDGPQGEALGAVLAEELGTVTATMEPGDVLAFGPYTYHRSTPNGSDRPRRVLINGYAYPGANTRIYPGEGAGCRRRLVDGDRVARSA